MMSYWPTVLTIAILSLFSSLTHAKSYISTFADANCQESITSLDGPNGYPNGTCTDFRRSGTYGSFQVVGLDAGCAVTIYEDDLSGDICSGTAIVASIAACYNSTWAFYSIDMCEAGGTANTIVPTFSSAATPVSTITPSTNSAAAASTSASASPNAAGSNKGSNTGAIVGGVVGGVLGLALIIGGTVLLTMRMMRKNSQKQEEAVISEVHADSMVPQKEVYEKMGNVPALPPVELPVGEHASGGAEKPKMPPT